MGGFLVYIFLWYTAFVNNLSMDWLFWFIIGGSGLILGSYLNSWMWRIYTNRWQWGGRSLCVHCGRQLTWSENIPLLSFVVLRGQCRTCHQRIPPDYFWVELVTPILFVLAASIDLVHGITNPWHIWRDLFFVALLLVIFVYDAKYYLILTRVVYGGAVVGFLINYVVLHISPVNMLLGAVVGAGFFWTQYVLSRGRWIGGGDVRLGLMMGILLGWPGVLVALFMAYVLGAFVSLGLLALRKKTLRSQLPFGTFLAIGTLVALFWGEQIIQWYLGFIRW